MHNPNQMQIKLTLRSFDSGKTFWTYDVMQRGEVVRSFLEADQAVAYIEENR